jgi:hypothetical protein
MYDWKRWLWIGIMAMAAVLIIVATGAGPAIAGGVVNAVDSTALFLWSLVPKG